MDSELIVTIVLGIITISVMIYIACRQGIFKKPKLSATSGTYGTLGKQIWSIVVGIKNITTEYYIVFLPYIIENRGDIALKETVVQFLYDKEFDSSIFNLLNPKLYDDKIFNYNINRSIKHIRNNVLVEYHIPLLPPKSPLYLEEPILIKKSEFNKTKTNFEKKIIEECSDKDYIIKNLRCNIFAENCKPFELNTQLIIAYSDDIHELSERTNIPAWNLFYRSCPKLFGRLYARRTKFAPPILPLCKKYMIYMQPKFLITKEGGKIAAVQIDDKTEYELRGFDMNNYTALKT